MQIFVDNLPHTFNEEDLTQLFASFGRVNRITFLRDRATGRAQGRALVEMGNRTEAHAALAALHGTSVEDRIITVQQARPPWTRTSLHDALVQSPPFVALT